MKLVIASHLLHQAHQEHVVVNGKVGVFGVVEHQVFHLKHFGLLSGIECCAVVLIVRAELFAVAIEAEGFAEEPVAVAHIGFIALVERFVAQAHHALSVGHEQPESILHGFGGAQIEASHIHIIHHQLFTIVHFLQDDALAYGAVNFSRDKESANGFECVFHFAVAVNEEFARYVRRITQRRAFWPTDVL